MLVFRRASLAQKVSAAILLGLALLASALLFLYRTTLHDYAYRQSQQRLVSNDRVAWDIVKRNGDPFRIVDGKLFAGQTELDGRNDLVDHITDLVGGVATVFRGDERVATNVKSANGSRAVGTKLAAGPVFDAVLKRGEPYRGKADILGEPYFTAYDPIKDASGAVIGVLFVGIPEADALAELAAIQFRAMTIASVIVLAIGAAALLLSQWMFSPLARLRAVMAKISEGEYDTPTIYVDRLDDIGEMAREIAGFKANAIERQRAERELLARKAAEQRTAMENERHQAERTRAAEEQTLAMQALADGLMRLSAGDLTTRLQTGVSERYAKIRDDFNIAAEKLGETLRAVIASASAINAGALEISAAADNLSQRTEREAAGVEATAAALNQITATLNKSAAGLNTPAKSSPTPTTTPRKAPSSSNRRSRRWTPSRSLRNRSAASSARSMKSPFKPTCWRSTPESRPRGREKPAGALPWSPPKFARWPNALRKPPRRSRA